MAALDTALSASADTSGALTETLPTRRVAFAKQLDILRAYGALGATQATTLRQVADVVGLKPDTASLTNSFFQAVGLVSRVESGAMKPAPEVVAFQRAYQWNPDTAGHEMAAIFEDAWFWQALAGHLALGRITEAKAMAVLGQAANATKNRAVELRVIMDFLEIAGLVVRDDGHVRAANERVQPAEPPPPAAAAPAKDRSGQDGGPLPLLIRGVIEQLPDDGKWTRSQVENWLKMAELAFDVAYEIEEDMPRRTSGSGGGAQPGR